MTRKRKNPQQQTKKELGTYEDRLNISNAIEPSIRRTVVSIMFSAGDSFTPIKENEDLVVNILKNELIVLLNDVVLLREDEESNGDIKLSEILFILHKQKGVVSRFFKYLTNRVTMASYVKTKCSSKSENIYNEECESDDEKEKKLEDDDIDEIDFIKDVNGLDATYMINKKKQISKIQPDDIILENLSYCLVKIGASVEEYQNYEDEHHKRRQQELLTVLTEMGSDTYKKYSIARQVSFQRHCTINDLNAESSSSSQKTSNKNAMDVLLKWIGQPPIEDTSVEVFLAFFAKEIIFEVVGAAVSEKIKEPPNIFKNDENYDMESLQLRHYEEAIRKNTTLRKYGRIFV